MSIADEAPPDEAPPDEAVIVLEGPLPADGLDHFFLPFDVPAGVAEIEVRHADNSEDNILDWGLDDPHGFRGWGGGNTEPAVVTAAAASRSYVPGEIVPGTWNVVVGRALVVEDAPYTVEVVLRTKATLAPQERTPYAPVNLGAGGWLQGDFHVHSDESGDARVSLDDIAACAVERGLDFVAITDHNTPTSQDWFADAQARWPELLFLPGIELTTYDGHANVLGGTTWIDHRIGQPGVTIDGVAGAVGDAVFSVNHPTLSLGDLCLGCAWEHELSPARIEAMEIITGGWEPVGQLFYEGNVALYDALWAKGGTPAAVGGSDDHTACQGTGPTDSPLGSPTTVVYASERSAAAILEGLARRRTYVKLQGPDDPALELGLVPSEAAEGCPTGRAQARVVGGAGSSVRWLLDGAVVGEELVSDEEAVLTYDAGAATGAVRAELWREGLPLVFASNQLLECDTPGDTGPARDKDAGTCGCSGGSAGMAPALLWLGARRRRRPTRS